MSAKKSKGQPISENLRRKLEEQLWRMQAIDERLFAEVLERAREALPEYTAMDCFEHHVRVLWGRHLSWPSLDPESKQGRTYTAREYTWHRTFREVETVEAAEPWLQELPRLYANYLDEIGWLDEADVTVGPLPPEGVRSLAFLLIGVRERQRFMAE